MKASPCPEVNRRVNLATPPRTCHHGPVTTDPARHPPARLTVICGPMFAGKTSELIRRATLALADGRSVRIFKPATDTRYAGAHVVSHPGQRHDAVALSSPPDLPALAHGFSFIAIDEAHFFGDALVAPILELLQAPTQVLVVGLERDHRGQPFAPFPRLLCEADEVIKLAGPCARCGRPSLHSQRLTPDTARIVVGGAEAYEPRCRECFVPGL